MLKKVFLVGGLFALAFAILTISIMRTASIKYEFAPMSSGSRLLENDKSLINYELPYPGGILPDHFLWSLKAVRDKFWLAVTSNQTRKAELKLLFADKRLVSAKIMFDKGKPELGFSVLTKAEKYLDEARIAEEAARKKGIDTTMLLKKLNVSSLKHFEVMEEIAAMAPDDAKPKIIEAESYPKKVYEETRNALNEKNEKPQKNPFNWQ